MAIQLADVQKLLREMGMKSFCDTEQGVIWFGTRGERGSYQVTVTKDMEGKFLQLRSMDYAHCPADHPHCDTLHRLLGEINYLKRVIKFGWDKKDGEVAAYADVIIGDGGLSQNQLHLVLGFFLGSLDECNPRIQQVIQTGKEAEEGPVRMALGAGG
jgi:hypothetical protein